MSRPLKCSKLSEAEEEDYVDRISSLPDELIGYMLSFLPTKCVVRTSILSSRWRCLHTLTNCLSFHAPNVYGQGPPEIVKAQKKGFKKFVNRVLLFHKVSPIKRFILNCGSQIFDNSQLHAWISAAILKGVEHLQLNFFGQLNALPHCLFSCKTLVELKIYSPIQGFRVPESTHLPSLKTLHLSNISFLDRDSFRKLFHACPMLQYLELDRCTWSTDSNRHVRLFLGELKRLDIAYCLGRVEVDAPNLAYLSYFCPVGLVVGLSLKNPDHLVTARLAFSYIKNPESIQNALALIKAVYNVKALDLLRETVQYLTHFEDDHIHTYPNLVKFKFDHYSFDAWKYVTYWLDNSSRLETLIFNQAFVYGGQWPPNVALAPFASRVKVIEVHNFCGYTTELVLLRYLLKNAKVLRRLILFQGEMTKKQELQASRKLLMLPRASKTCVIQLKK